MNITLIKLILLWVFLVVLELTFFKGAFRNEKNDKY